MFLLRALARALAIGLSLYDDAVANGFDRSTTLCEALLTAMENQHQPNRMNKEVGRSHPIFCRCERLEVSDRYAIRCQTETTSYLVVMYVPCALSVVSPWVWSRAVLVAAAPC